MLGDHSGLLSHAAVSNLGSAGEGDRLQVLRATDDQDQAEICFPEGSVFISTDQSQTSFCTSSIENVSLDWLCKDRKNNKQKKNQSIRNTHFNRYIFFFIKKVSTFGPTFFFVCFFFCKTRLYLQNVAVCLQSALLSHEFPFTQGNRRVKLRLFNCLSLNHSLSRMEEKDSH